MTWVLKHARHGNKPWAVQTAALKACEASGLNKYGYWLEQGLGKTALVLNEFANMDVSLMVVVCPNSFKADWAMAPAEWGMPKIKTGIWPHDTPRNGPMEKSLFAINYEATRRGFSSYKMLEDVLICTIEVSRRTQWRQIRHLQEPFRQAGRLHGQAGRRHDQ